MGSASKGAAEKPARLMRGELVNGVPARHELVDIGEEVLWVSLNAALQIINHLQDCADDYRNLDRVYLPLEDLERFGYAEEELGRGVVDERFVELMRFERPDASRSSLDELTTHAEADLPEHDRTAGVGEDERGNRHRASKERSHEAPIVGYADPGREWRRTQRAGRGERHRTAHPSPPDDHAGAGAREQVQVPVEPPLDRAGADDVHTAVRVLPRLCRR